MSFKINNKSNSLIQGALIGSSDEISTATQNALNLKENTITAGTTAQYYRGDKTWQTLDKNAVGLSNVANVDTTNASNISTGTLDDARLSNNITSQGNTFNGANQLLKLDINGKVSTANLPPAVLGSLSYKGTWDASTNNPAIQSSIGEKGEFYKVSIAGSTSIDGINDWKLGDWIVFNSTTWDKIDNTESVISVNSKVGAVVIDKSDVGLFNVDNTSDLLKPISTATQSALDLKANITDVNTSLALKEDKANKGVANGYAELDATGKVPLNQLPNIASSIATLSDVALGQLNNNDVLVYNTSLTKWENKSIQDVAGGEVVPIGSIQAFYSNTIPAGYLLCDGSTFNAVDYPDLNTFLGSNTLPDLRGYFLRGLGGVDPDAGTRTLGSIQQDEFKSHTHELPVDQFGTIETQSLHESGGVDEGIPTDPTKRVFSASAGGLETRPKNIAVNYIIKAKHNPASAYNLVGGTDISITTNELNKTATISSTGYTNAQIDTALNLKENTITAGTTAQYYRGDKTFQTLDKNAVGLSNVDNTSDLLKPISTATQTALDLKEDKANKNIAGGYAGLDSNSLISIPQITPSRFLTAGSNITLDEDPTTKILTISSSGGGGGGGGGSSGLPSDTLFSFRERIGSINWTINGGSNTFFNFTDEFFTQTIVDEDFNFLTGANPYFIYDSVGQKLLMRSNLINQRIKFKITLRVSYNGGAGSEFGFVLGRPSLTTNTSITNTIEVIKTTQGQNIQSSQPIKVALTLFTTLLPTTGGTDPFQTEGFKLGFFNYSTNTSITITDAQLVIEQIN